MATIDIEFQELCKKILSEGDDYENKNRGVKRLQIPSYTFRHNLKLDGFPMITNKKMWLKGIVGELIWFLRGDNDVEYLNQNGIKIWNKDAYNWHKKHGGNLTFQEFEAIGKGSVGQNYSVQWRNYNDQVDQIKELIEGMKKDIMSSRLRVSAWNACELDETALPPCHSEFQVIGVPLPDGEFGFELHWTQRSVDVFLGLPFNIASYATLALILEKITGFQAIAIEGNLKCVHFYDNQYDAVEQLLLRNPNTHQNCEMEINLPSKAFDSYLTDIFNYFEPNMFKLIDYTSDDEIKVEMLAPKNI